MRQLAYRRRSLRGLGVAAQIMDGGPISINRFGPPLPPVIDPAGEQGPLHPVDGPFPCGKSANGSQLFCDSSGNVIQASGTPAITTVTSSLSPPSGSYLQTSKNVTFDGRTLSANCQRIDGTFAFSTLDVTTCAGDIANINGVLTCNQALPPAVQPPALSPGVTPIPTNGPLPPGSGWQQVEAPGNPFPYVWIGQGTPPAVNPVVYPSTAAVNVPMPGGVVLNPATFSLPSFSSGSSLGSQISNFFSQYGTYLLIGSVVIVGYKFATRSGGRR